MDRVHFRVLSWLRSDDADEVWSHISHICCLITTVCPEIEIHLTLLINQCFHTHGLDGNRGAEWVDPGCWALDSVPSASLWFPSCRIIWGTPSAVLLYTVTCQPVPFRSLRLSCGNTKCSEKDIALNVSRHWPLEGRKWVRVYSGPDR